MEYARELTGELSFRSEETVYQGGPSHSLAPITLPLSVEVSLLFENISQAGLKTMGGWYPHCVEHPACVLAAPQNDVAE